VPAPLGSIDLPPLLIQGWVFFQVEACDLFGGFLTAQSMAGGTGSGLGKLHFLPGFMWACIDAEIQFPLSEV